jgi:hypothetical protein
MNASTILGIDTADVFVYNSSEIHGSDIERCSHVSDQAMSGVRHWLRNNTCQRKLNDAITIGEMVKPTGPSERGPAPAWMVLHVT